MKFVPQRKVAPLVVVAYGELDALVADVTRLCGVVLVTGRAGQRHVDRLVVGVRTVVGDVEVELVQEAGIDADLPRAGILGTQVVVGVGCRGFPSVALLDVGVARVREVAVEGRSHLGVRCADLEEGEPVGQIDHVGDDSREADRRVEERRLLRIGQHRGPLVAAREREVEHRAPAHLDVGEDGLRLVMPALLVELELLGRVEVQRREEVGGLQVACHAGHLVALVVDRGADLGVEGPVLAELLVDVGDHVAVERAVGLRLILQSSVVAGEGGQRRGVVLARHAVLRVVDPHAAGDVEPVGDLPLERGVEHVAALVRFAVHALLDPVGFWIECAPSP